jgi:single-strand DNA-binding protein
MADQNAISLTGRLVRDPEGQTTGTGKECCSFTVAVSKAFKPQNPDDPEADFIRCVAWQQKAKYLCDYGGKGRRIFVSGRLSTRKYTDRDGNAREITEVVVNELGFLDRGDDQQSGSQQSGGQQSNYRQPAAAAASRSSEEYDPFADE